MSKKLNSLCIGCGNELLGKIDPLCPDCRDAIKKANSPDFIQITWAVEDVLQVCPELSEDEAREVLRQAEHYHDAQYGINEDTLEILGNDLLQEKNHV